MRPVFIKTFGCKVNYSESVSFADLLRAAGFTPLEIEGAELPDAQEVEKPIVFVNSCCVTQEAERKAAQFVRRVKRLRPESEVLFSGCGARNYAARAQYAQAGARIFDFYPEAFEWLRENAPEVGAEHRSARTSAVSPHNGPSAARPLQVLPRSLPTGIVGESRARAFIKLQDGCHNCCSFCIIPFVRPYASRPYAEVLAELDLRLASGIREIVLTGVNIGHYGLTPIASVHEVASREHFKRSKLYAPVPGHPTLWDLIDAVLARLDAAAAHDGIEARLRISSIEPEEIEPRFFEQLTHPRMCPHLHLPLQSGSERVLAAMRRLYSLDTYMRRVERFRRACPYGALTTDIITGYPGETEAEFEATLAVVSAAGFERVHAFPFSPRPGTRAALEMAQSGRGGPWSARAGNETGDSSAWQLAPVPADSKGRQAGAPVATRRVSSPQFDKALALERNRRLIAHAEAVAEQRWQRFVGRDCAMLIEDRQQGYFLGTGEAYQQLRLNAEALSGEAAAYGGIIPVRLGAYGNGNFSAAALQPATIPA